MKKTGLLFICVFFLAFGDHAFSQTGELGANALYEQGLDYYQKGLRRLAADSFSKCLAVDPAHKGAEKYLGMIGQAHIELEVKESLQRYEVKRDRSLSADPSSRGHYPEPSRNLDYMTAQSSRLSQPSPASRLEVAQASAQAAKEDFAGRYDIRQEAIEQARNDYEADKSRQVQEKKRQKERARREIVNQTLQDARFKMSLGYAFVGGEQSFRLINENGGRLSKLTYPIKGGLGIIDAEYRLTPKWSVGGRWMSSNFKNRTSKDEDWNFVSADWPRVIEYQLTEQDTKNRAEYFDANIYYRAFDWDRQQLSDYISEMLLVDRLYIDVFGGYQHYKARHIAMDPITEYIWEDSVGLWRHAGLPLHVGLNSIYEVNYKGPRLGLRLGGSITEKVSSHISFSYAWLKTKSYGHWNLRDFNWRHEGSGLGRAFTTDVEAIYHITPNWFVGAGFHYMYQKQDDLLYSGSYPGASWSDLDQARDTQMHLYGPSLKAGMRW
jgi:hypothetical protein